MLLVGGSSRIPLVARMISEALDRPPLVDAHPKYAVALGAATLAAEFGASARGTAARWDRQRESLPATAPGTRRRGPGRAGRGDRGRHRPLNGTAGPATAAPVGSPVPRGRTDAPCAASTHAFRLPPRFGRAAR